MPAAPASVPTEIFSRAKDAVFSVVAGSPCWNKKNPLLRVLAFWKGDGTTDGIDC